MKPKTSPYRKILEKKAEEVRHSMSAQKAAQVVSRLDTPSDEGDLSQHHHEEWIFLNRNTIDMKLLREISDALHRMDIGQYGVCGRTVYHYRRAAPQPHCRCTVHHRRGHCIQMKR